MWPRNQESASRNRHTGFVCFRHRCDAEDCLAACDERDVFNKGRNIFLRWGKHVAMDMPPQQQQQSGCLTSGPIKNPQYALSPSVQFDPVHHERLTICIVTPVDARRVNLITLVASFVAKDGRQLEVELQNRRANDNDFQFLFYGKGDPIDHLYYKWRVYAFANGDGQYLWRTEPFQMLQDGCFWIPPPLEKEAAQRELVYLEEQRRQQERQQQERRLQTARRDYVTGRQLENKRNRSTKLSPRELEELTVLFQRNLCAARVPICEAMAFAFEKSVAATQICDILKDLLTTQSDPDVEVMIARIYLLSDILFNSQQPGVKNAFKFRDAIEKMAPNIFKALRSPYGESLGRMTQNKLARVVRNVLAAWGEWNVFNTQFLEELTAYFEGREPASEVSILTSTFDVNLLAENTLDDQPAANDKQISIRKTGAAFEPVVDHESDRLHEEDGEPLDDDDVNGEPIDDDGEPMSDDEDLDGEPMYDDADGEPIDDDTDGQPDGDDYKPIVDDGDRMSDGGDTDGEPLDGEVDGEPIDDDADCRPRDYDHAAADSQHVEDGEVPDDGRLL
jgi:U2-associated protein SR140